MQKAEKYKEPFLKTLIRTVITAAIIAFILFLSHAFPVGGKDKLALFEMIWTMVFWIVFGGHWLEVLFINYIKFALPANALIYVSRVIYWFLCAIPLFFIMNMICSWFSYKTANPDLWWVFGLFYIGIQLIMHGLMQIRTKKSFYNGVY